MVWKLVFARNLYILDVQRSGKGNDEGSIRRVIGEVLELVGDVFDGLDISSI